MTQKADSQIKLLSCQTYIVDIFIGNKRGYNGPYINKFDVEQRLSKIQEEAGEMASTIRLTSVEYVFKGYNEYGWQISLIKYPRFEKSDWDIRNFALQIAEKLLVGLDQNRITIVLPEETIMLESPNAEVTHVRQPLSEAKVE